MSALRWVLLYAAVGVMGGCRIGFEHLSDEAGDTAATTGGRDATTGGAASAPNGGASTTVSGGGAGRPTSGAAGAATGGVAGAGGTVGTAGTSGTGGAAGGAGTPGTGGAVGTSGTSGTGGAAGAPPTGGGGGSTGGAAGAAATGGGGTGGSDVSGGTGGEGGEEQPGDLHVTTSLDEDDPGATVADPGGDGLSLREALAMSNASSGGLSITFDPGLVIALDYQLQITESVSVRGDGTTLDCAAIGNSDDCISLAVSAGTTQLDDFVILNARRRPIRILSGTDYQITNSTIRDAGDAVEVGVDASNVLIASNLIAGSGTDGIDVFGADVAIVDNVIIDSNARGVLVSGNGARLVGNLVIRGNRGIQVSLGMAGTVIRHNTLVSQASDGILIDDGQVTEITNNVTAYAGSWGLISGDSPTVTRDHNAYFANGSGPCSSCSLEPNAVTTDPLFVDPGLDDYTPDSGSPLIDAGTDTGEDRNGSRPDRFDGVAPDIGYVEVE